MEDVFIYSHQKNEEKFIQDIVLAAFKLYAKFELQTYQFNSLKSKFGITHIYENSLTEYRCSVIAVSKKYQENEDDEFLIFYTGGGDHIIEEYEGEKAYSLGSTEGISDNYNITLDWCIEYLKINPSHIVCSHDGHIFTLNHLLLAKEKGVKNWLYQSHDELI